MLVAERVGERLHRVHPRDRVAPGVESGVDLGQREWPADPNEHTERGVAKRSAMKRESPGWRHRCDWRRATDSRPTNPRVDVAGVRPVSYTHLRAHETDSYLVCRL